METNKKLKQNISNKKLFFIGVGVLILGRIIMYIFGGIVGVSIAVASDFIGFLFVAISFVRYLINVFSKKHE